MSIVMIAIFAVIGDPTGWEDIERDLCRGPRGMATHPVLVTERRPPCQSIMRIAG
ncbi:MAG: hypothetical protein ACFCVD_06715 [Nodosilinea sp.]